MTILKTNLFLLLILSAQLVLAQNPVMDTRAQDRDLMSDTRKSLTEASLYDKYPFQNVGPTIMSGRITDIAVNPNDATEFYAAYASGGLWHTTNNGTTFTPIFDNESVMTIGAIAVEWTSQTIYVGTGEVNSSRSSYAGNGIYKSIDKGESWTNIGLPESHHIGKIIVDSANPNRVLVAALGHLYSPNIERGLYLSEDGGITWQHTFFVNEKSGGVDMVQDPTKPNVIYASFWQRERRAWNFVESGSGSGIYKSIDGGKNWGLISSAKSGFPIGEGVGRIGLDIGYKEGKTYLYAILDNYNRRPKEDKKDKKTEGLVKDDFKSMDSIAFLKLEDEKLESFLRDNGFPAKYDAKKVKALVKSNKIGPVAVAEYLEDANSLLFDTDVIGAEVYLSIDEGATFQKTHEGYINGLFNSYGYYFGQIRTEKENPSVVYTMGVPILRSDDYGKTWKNVNGENVHVDHHALWINPKNPNHIINGNDGGINISYDKGESWIKCNSPSVGQFYYINVDNAKPYNIYGGLQDNGVWIGSNEYEHSVSWHQNGKYPYQVIIGGDGMQIQIDNRDHNIIYTGFQFGNYFRINQATGERSYITPKHDLGDRPYRWNWQTPILLSPHNQDILYMGSNKLMRSLDKGENFKAISDDLTKGGIKGDVAYGTIVAIDESIFTFGKILIGTDDGKVHLTNDGGVTWNDISLGLPNDRWVSRAIVSKHDKNTLYVTLNGYRWDDFGAYVYKSINNGKNWEDLSAFLPSEPINVLKEDPTDGDILYLGTDHGLYISLNGGVSFETLAEEMPNVAVHDVVIQEEEGHLLVGTHGRSIYKLDLEYIRATKAMRTDIKLFADKKVNHRSNWGFQYASYSKISEPKFHYTVVSKQKTAATMSILDTEEHTLYTEQIELKKGVNAFTYNLALDPSKQHVFEKSINKEKKKDEKLELKKGDNGTIYLIPGEYKIQIKTEENQEEVLFKIKD